MTTVHRDDLLDSRYDRVRQASYLALDVDNWQQANRLVSLFGEAVDGYKVGLQLFHGDGPTALEQLSVGETSFPRCQTARHSKYGGWRLARDLPA